MSAVEEMADAILERIQEFSEESPRLIQSIEAAERHVRAVTSTLQLMGPSFAVVVRDMVREAEMIDSLTALVDADNAAGARKRIEIEQSLNHLVAVDNAAAANAAHRRDKEIASFEAVYNATAKLRDAYRATREEAELLKKHGELGAIGPAPAAIQALARARAELAKQDLQQGHADNYAAIAQRLAIAIAKYREAATAAKELSNAETDGNEAAISAAMRKVELAKQNVDALRIEMQVAQQGQSADLAANVVEAEAAFRSAAAAAEHMTDATTSGAAKGAAATDQEVESAKALARAQLDAARAALQASADGTNAARAQAEAEKALAASKAASAKRKDDVNDTFMATVGLKKVNEHYQAAKRAATQYSEEAAVSATKVKAAINTIGAAGGGVLSLIGLIVDLSVALRSSAAEGEQHQDRVLALGPAFEQMRAATAGAIDEQVAFNLQNAVLVRGLDASAPKLATLAAGIRMFARDQQVSQSQAASTLQSALDGDERAALQYGLSISTATTATERYNAIVGQLETSTQAWSRSAGHGALSASEAMQVQSDRTSKAWSMLGKFVYESSALKLVEQGVLRVAEGWEWVERRIGRTTNEQRQANRASVEARELAEAKSRDQQHDSQQTLEIVHAELLRANVQLDTLPIALNGERHYQRALRESQELTRRAGESDLQYNERRKNSAQNLLNAIQRRNAELDRDDSVRRGTAELGILAQKLRANGLHVASVIESVTHEERFVQLQQEALNLQRRENEERGAFNTRATGVLQALQSEQQAREQLRQQRAQAAERAHQERMQERRAADERRALEEEYRDLLRESEQVGAKIATWEERVYESRTEALQRHIELQRAAVDAAHERQEAARQAFDSFRDEVIERRRLEDEEQQRAQAKVDEERIDERRRQDARDEAEQARRQHDQQSSAQDQPINRLKDAFGLAEERSRTATQSMAAGAKAAYDGFGELAAGIAGAVKQAADGGKDAGAAVAKYVDDWAGAKALQWGLQAAESLAGAGVAYFIRPDAVPGLLASAAMYAGLAAVAGITTAAIPNAPADGAPGQTGSTSQALAESSRNNGGGGGNDKPSIVFNISGIMANEQTQEALVRGLRDAQSRGLIDLRGL